MRRDSNHGIEFIFILNFISFFTLHDALQAPLMRKKSVMGLNTVFGEKHGTQVAVSSMQHAGEQKLQVRKNGQMCYISQGVRAVLQKNVCTLRQAARDDYGEESSPKNVSQNPDPH